jgi:hypothetical protein
MFGLNLDVQPRICRISATFFAALVSCLFFLFPGLASAQNWVWTNEVVDTSGRGMSLAVDDAGNVHISYGEEKAGLKYGFRQVGLNPPKWFTLPLGGGVSYTHTALDSNGNPAICATYLTLPMRYFHFDGKHWDKQEIAPEDNTSVQAACSVVITANGTPHVSWYHLIGAINYAHIRVAELQNGAWLMRTLDFDVQTGKWHAMVLDAQGNPCISYDAFVKGLLKFARWDGKKWNIRVVDSRGLHGPDYSLGMGSSLAFDAHGNAHIVYYSDTEMRHAWQTGDTWKEEVIDNITPSGSSYDYRSSLVFDKDGLLHLSYEDSGMAKHAFFDGKEWHVQVIAPSGASASRFSSMAIDHNQNILYYAYRDAVDGSLRVAVGHKTETPQTAASGKPQGKN